jgi:serine/threonine-protein kinase HipA
MHLKNLSRLRAGNDLISSAPVHDLVATRIVLLADKEKMALTINGKKRNLRIEDFDTLAKAIEIKKRWQRALM